MVVTSAWRKMLLLAVLYVGCLLAGIGVRNAWLLWAADPSPDTAALSGPGRT